MDRERGRRLWRLRKVHQYLDAEVAEQAASNGVLLRFLFNGELSYQRLCATIGAAHEEAAAKRGELERQGWTFHW
jgi:hypothetical protein